MLACIGGTHAATSAPAKNLPASIWALQPAAGSTIGARQIKRLRAQGLNVVVIEGRQWTPAAVKRLHAVAAKGGLRLLVATADASRSAAQGCAAARALGSAACAVKAPRVKGIAALGRKRGIAVVVVRLAGPGQLLDIRLPARARLLAVLPVPRTKVDTALWLHAIARVRKEPRLDLAFVGSVSGVQGRQLLELVRSGARSTSAEPTLPPNPSGLYAATATANSVTVGWQPGAAGSFTYRVYLDGRLAGSTTTPSWRFDALVCGTAYEVSIEAAADEKASSQTSLIVRTSACGGGGGSQDVSPPTIPVGVAKTAATSTSITLGWSPALDNVSVAGYGLYVGSVRVTTISLMSHVFGALACGATHSLGVDAFDDAGNRSLRVSISASTNACPAGPVDSTPPTTPAGLAAGAASETGVSISWSPSSDNVGVTGYGLYLNDVLVASTGSTSYSFVGLACGTVYVFGVDALDAAGNRSSRASATASTGVCSAPPASPPSGSASVYVSSGGSDSAGCSVSAPCRSFDRAYRVARAGEVVEVAAGSYGSQSIGKDAAKTSAADVLFRPAAGATVTLSSLSISGSHVEVRDMRLTTDGSVGSSPIDTRDVTLRNLTGRSLFLRADDTRVIGGSYGGFNACDAGAPEDGVKLWNDSSRGADGIVLDGVTIHDVRRTGCSIHSDCIQIYSGTNHTIKNSTLVNCPTSGIIARPSDSSQKLENITIENNYFGAVLDGSEAINIGTAPDRCSGMVIRYNTVVNESSSFDCLTASGGPGSLVEGNIISVGAGNDATFRNNVFRTGSALVGSSAVQCNPTYRNSAAGDWRLASTDTCARGRGNPTSHPTTDAEGQPRPQGTIDAGADETG